VRLPRLVVLPVESLGDGDLVETTAAGLSEELNLALVAFGIVATASAPDSMLDSAALATLRDDLDAGYALAGSARSENDSLRFTFRLFETDSGTQLWTNAYDYPPEAIQAGNIEQALATIVASLMSSPFGPIYGHEIALVSRLPSAELDPYQCLLRFYGYARTFGRADHAESVACMQRAVLTEPDFDSGWGALSTLYLHEHTFGYTQQPDREPPLMRALEAVRRALDIDGSSRLAAITLPAIQLAAGNKEEYQRAIDRALAIEPSHPAVRAQVGYVLTIAGDWQRGVPMIEAALPLTADEPGWYYISFAFRGLLTESYADALDWSLRIDAPEWFFTPLTVAASAALAGRLDLAEREIERLLVLYPNFEREGRAQLAAMPLDDVLRSRLILGLSLAGMELG
jgi:TolB-like protein